MGVSLIILYLSLYAVKITVAQTENIQDQLSMCELYDGIILREGHFQSGNINEELSWFPCNNQITGGYCPRGSRMCLQESSTSQPFPLDLGETLTDVPKELSYTTRLVHSKGFVKCKQDPMKNYTIYVSLDESAAKAYLRRCGDDRCAFELRIPDPGRSGELPCTKRVEDGGAADLVLDFRKLIDDFIVEGSDGMRRVFNLCRLATGCNDPSVSSCSYTSASSTAGNSRSVWGDLTTRLITYENGAVQFQFRSGSKKSGGLMTKVDVHCNWTVMQDVNPIYLSKTSSQRISKFVIQSSLGCVKLPMNCKFFGDDYNEYEYDLSDLYRPNGNVWNVENDRHTSIRMNICGPLRSTIEECQKTHSQICGEILFDKQQRQRQLSYGSILVDKKTDGGDILTARLVHGSVCPKYSNTTLTTNLKWKCSYKEKGPKLISIGDCSIDILWETPKACPASVITVSSLNIYDHLGHRNLTGLCVGDRSSSVMPPSSLPTAYFTYNFCKPLGKKCNGMSNVSVCLYLNRTEKILGYYKNTKLSSRNGILSMEFTGDGCLKTNISFHCDYSAPASGIVQIFQTDDDACTYRISVKSPSVCATRLNSDGGGSGSKVCIIKSGNSIYNLTALTKYDENYRILNNNSGDDDETRRKNEFHFNICNPLITGPSSMCKPNSAICLHNTSEPNFRNRFFTIGNYPGVLNLTNDQVHLEFINGDMCSNRQFASAKITFVCVTDRHEDTPVLVKSDGCRYEFVWKTNYSCPKIVENHISYTNSSPSSSCVIPYGNEKFLNLTSIEHKRFQIYHNEERANLTFDVCNMNYTKSYANGRKEVYYFDRIVTDKDMEYNLARQINCKRTTSENSWNILKMRFDCRYNEEDVFKIKKINNCTAYIQCNSVLFCKEVVQETRNEATVIAEKLENAIAVVLEKIQNLTLNKHVDVKQANETQETVRKNEEKSTVKDQSTSNLRQRQQPKQSSTIYKDVTVCIIKIGTKEIYLNKLSPVTIQSRSGNRYTIGNTARVNGRPEDANRCNDYVCKGGTTIATLNTCPNVTVTDGDGDETRTPEIQLTFHYTSQQQQQQLRGQAQPFVTTIFLKCNSTAEKSEVKDEKDTSLTLSYPIGDVCLPPASSSKPAALIITGCVILIVIFFAIITFYLYKRRTYLRLRKSDKSDLYLYARDAQA